MIGRADPSRILNPGAITNANIYYRSKTPFLLIMMRINLKLALVCLTFMVLCVTLLLWTKCGMLTTNNWSIDTPHANLPIPLRLVAEQNRHVHQAEEIDCNINKEYIIKCRKENDEIYVPFSFIEQYFEVYGKLNADPTHNSLQLPRFDWSHSYGRIYRPKRKYDPRGVFMHFENYNVEVRERVKCISATDGVPVSTQWEQQGYYYPTQIAQFGLSHYSKNLTNPEPKCLTIENADDQFGNWYFHETPREIPARIFDPNRKSAIFRRDNVYDGPDLTVNDDDNDLVRHNDYGVINKDGNRESERARQLGENEHVNYDAKFLLSRTYDNQTNNKFLKFETLGQIIFNLSDYLQRNDASDLFVMRVDVNLSNNASLSVVLHHVEHNKQFTIHYVKHNAMVYAQDPYNIVYGLGASSGWQKLTRDLLIDLQKGLLLTDVKSNKRSTTASGNYKISKSNIKLVQLVLHGQGILDNLSLCSNEHMSHFYNAAEWFVAHQDPATGGWANPVRRRVARGFDDLRPGWYSAMGQGHAISVLSRAYYRSGNSKYLRAAIAGLKPFRVASHKGGVLSTFLDKYNWYEEYPTQPASFVLNGFIYSLLGIYDLKTIATDDVSPTRRDDKQHNDRVERRVGSSTHNKEPSVKRWKDIKSIRTSTNVVEKQRQRNKTKSAAREAELLFDEGMTTLKGMLLLFDTGSGTAYDLRHFTLGVSPNLARWDYHATHVNQLLILATLDNSSVIHNTVERWYGYMFGKRASHN